MKKNFLKLILLGTAIAFFPACNNDDPGNAPEQLANLKTTISFSQTNDLSRAPGSTAIPSTSWDNITNMQLFLYDETTRIIKASKNIAPAPNQTSPMEYEWKDVPVGTYRLAIITNAATSTDAVTKKVGGTVVNELTQTTTYGRLIDNVLLEHKELPAANLPTTSYPTDWYLQPAEIFTGYSANPVVVTDATTINAGMITLKRDVSMMRVRVDPKNNTDADMNAAKSFLRIQRIPITMDISHDNGGTVTGVATTDLDGKVLGGAGSATFNIADPSTGYSPTQIITPGSFAYWNDVIIFPNMPRNSYPSSGTIPTPTQGERYAIVIAAEVSPGHVFADGSIAGAGAVAYWNGIIDDGFFNNMIREVNVTLDTGGDPTEPDKVEFGNVKIDMAAPEPWDSNILDTSISM